MTIGYVSWSEILKMPTCVAFWTNGAYIGSLTGTAVSTGAAATRDYLVVSIINGAAGGVDSIHETGDLRMVQRW